jgi:hypothetical protein
MARTQTQPLTDFAIPKTIYPDLGLLRPASDRNQQLGPARDAVPSCRLEFSSVFLSAMCSAINSARTSSLVCTFFSKYSIRFCFSLHAQLALRQAGGTRAENTTGNHGLLSSKLYVRQGCPLFSEPSIHLAWISLAGAALPEPTSIDRGNAQEGFQTRV